MLTDLQYTKITISGLICTGKTSLFSSLHSHLGWPSFSASEFFRDYSKIHGVSLEKAEEQNEILTKDVDLGMEKKLKEKGNLILEGWMAGIMADHIPGVLRVLLTSDEEVRIARFSAREGIPHEEAKARVIAREHNLVKKLQMIYQRSDFIEAKNYNFILDTSTLTKEQTRDRVLDVLHL